MATSAKAEVSAPGLFNPISRRFHVLLLIMIGYFALVYMRTNLGLAMTCMVNSTAQALRADENIRNTTFLSAVKSDAERNAECGGEFLKGNHRVNDYGGSLDWDSDIQAHLFSASFYGALLSLIPGGILADKYSPKMLLSVTCVTSVICSLALPYLALNMGWEAVFVSRFVMGIGEAFILPSINKIVSQWIPTEELSTAASVYTTGNQLAGFVGFPVSAFLCGSAFGWPSIFYVCAAIGLIWLGFWSCAVSDRPVNVKWMSERERRYLETKIEHSQSTRRPTIVLNSADKDSNTNLKIPYRKMLCSLPVWALIICTFTANMIVVLIQNGLFSAAPHLSQFLVKMGWSVAMDELKKRKLSPSAACKISQGFSTVTVSALFVILASVGSCSQPYISLLLLCLITMCFSTAISGFYTCILSLAPLYTGVLTSITMLAGYLGRLVTPMCSAQPWGTNKTEEDEESVPNKPTADFQKQNLLSVDDNQRASQRLRQESLVGSMVFDLME